MRKTWGVRPAPHLKKMTRLNLELEKMMIGGDMKSTVIRASCTRCGFVDYIDMVDGRTQEYSASVVGWEFTNSVDLCPECVIKRDKISTSYGKAMEAFHDNLKVRIDIKVKD